jgi:alanyl aminopeptidase
MVGPFDVVAGPDVPPTETRPRPVPLRGVAVKGKGRLLGYALAHLGSYVTALEEYFGIAYPWEKLDVIAIPDFGPGAMENVGAITFREWLLLLEGENAPADQRHAFTAVATHELAHQWFGDLVTMAWWDDIWLNEAFASWMEAQVLQKLDPTLNTEVEMISAAQGAMASDSLESARRIRQPIVTTDDIFNAFDGLTYRKGAGVIGMFEQWVGVETFRKGVRSYLESHRYGNGSTFDFLQSISKAAGRDVEAPFLTFLNQPGVPIVDATLECKPGHAAIHVHQERYRPLGSHIDPVHTWQIPFCFRYGTGATDHEACALVTGSEQTIPLTDTACPDWLLPNRGGAGYYRFSLPADAARKLTAVRAKLNIPEQLALLDSIQAGEAADRLDIPTERTLLEPFASSPDRFVATAPMGPYGFIRNQIATPAERPLVERSADALYAPIGKLLAERLHVLSNEELLLLRSILGFQLETGRDAALRSEAASAGRRYLGLDPAVAGSPSLFDAASFLDLAVRTAVDAGDAGVFDTAVEHLRQTHEPAARSRLIRALGYATGPLGVRARALVLDPILRPSEVFLLLGTEASRPETREETWQWVQQHGDELIARLPEEHRGGVPFLASNFCSEERAREAEAYFQPRIARLPGGPRNLAGALESVRLCAARLQAHGPAVRALFKTEAQERPAR